MRNVLQLRTRYSATRVPFYVAESFPIYGWGHGGDQEGFCQIELYKKSRKQRKVPDFLRNQELFGGDYWTRTSDLLRVNGLGKLFLTVSSPIQHRRILVQNYLTIVCPGVSTHSAPHCGYSCGQNLFPPDLQIRRETVFLFAI